MLPLMTFFFFKNLFYQKNCKDAMKIGGGQIRGAFFNFFVVFFASSGHCPQFLQKPLGVVLKKGLSLIFILTLSNV